MGGCWWWRQCWCSCCCVVLAVGKCSGLCCNRWTLQIAADHCRLWRGGRSVNIIYNGHHCAQPLRQTAPGSVPYAVWLWENHKLLLVALCITACWMGVSSLGSPDYCVWEMLQMRHTLQHRQHEECIFFNILPVILHVPGVEQGPWNDFTKRCLVTKNFLNGFEVWSKYIALVIVAPDDFSKVGLK